MAKQIKKATNPLAWNVPIVSPTSGTPTPEFQRKWAQQQSINDKVPQIPSDVTTVLDLLGSVTGDMLQRSPTGWGVILPPNDATKFLNGAIPSAWAQVKDTDLSLTDNTGNDVTTGRHGFVPKAPNDATKFLDGTGVFSVPASGSGGAAASFEIDSSHYYAAVVDTNGQLVLDGSGNPIFIKDPVFPLLSLSGPLTVNQSNAAPDTDPSDATINSRFISPSGSNASILVTGYADHPYFYFRRAEGSAAAPLAAIVGDTMGGLVCAGHDGTAWSGIQAGITCTSVENWAVGKHGTRLRFFSTPAGSATFAEVANFLDTGQLQIFNGFADKSYSFQTPATGATITIANTCSRLILKPAGTIATLTINMPAAPVDGQVCRISSTQTVTTLTMSGNGNTLDGGLATLAAHAFGEWTFVLSQTTWFRTG